MFIPAARGHLLCHLVPAVTCSNVSWDAVDSRSSSVVEFCIANRCTLCEQMVILGNTVVTKHELGPGGGPGFTASALALTPGRRHGTAGSERGGYRASAGSPDAPWCRDWPSARLPPYGPPTATRPHKEIDEI